MDLSSLQQYPWPKGGPPLVAIKAEHELSPRKTRLLRDLVLLLAIMALLYGLRPIATAIEHRRGRHPLPFALVMERFDRVERFASRQQVEQLLGAPSQQVNPTIDLEAHLQQAVDMNQAKDAWQVRSPELRLWQTWSDPQDEAKWVVILFVENKVYYKAKHGF